MVDFVVMKDKNQMSMKALLEAFHLHFSFIGYVVCHVKKHRRFESQTLKLYLHSCRRVNCQSCKVRVVLKYVVQLKHDL